MSAVRGQPIADLFLLTWASGVLDALSFLRAHVFTANMTGNTVILGLALAKPVGPRAYDSALAIAAFAAGVLVAAVVLVRLGKPSAKKDLRAGTSLELPFVILFTVVWVASSGSGGSWIEAGLIVSGACALGVQSVAARRLKISGAVTTFITGTITTAIVSFLERNETGARVEKEAKSSPLFLAAMVFVYIAAAAAGAALSSALKPLAPLAALAAVLAVWLRSLASSNS